MRKWRENGEREGTHNRLAAPVLMLRPAGPLADLAKAIVDRGGGFSALLTVLSQPFMPFCRSACLQTLMLVWQEMCDAADLNRRDAIRCETVDYTV